ncbi:MAG: V-type ATP synthase subunit D [Chloroflexota bacterium]|jgi:V/A-type H+-transporting ATPase subunit D
MPRVRVPLTRSTLLETQRLLVLAREGHDLLDRKREILLAELLSAAPEADQARDSMVQSFQAAYDALAAARMAMGGKAVRRAALAVHEKVPLKVTERSNMGAVVPTIQCSVQGERPAYSLAGTAAELDRAIDAFRELIGIVCDAAEKETTVLRLAREARGTQRRVNALRNVVIPQQEQIIKQVREALEDAERESFFRAKMLKRRK